MKQGLCQQDHMKHFDGVPFCLTALSAPFSLILGEGGGVSLAVSFAVTLSALSFTPFWLLFAALAQAFALAGFFPSEWQLKDKSVLWLTCASFAEFRWSKINLWETEEAGARTDTFTALLVQTECKAVNLSVRAPVCSVACLQAVAAALFWALCGEASLC